MSHSIGLRFLRQFGFLALATWSSSALAAEGGYSNYIPGTYGDFAVAVAPGPGLTLRNDVYYYSADESRAVLQGAARAELDVSFTLDMITALYATDQKLMGGKYAFGALVPFVRTDIEARVSAAVGAASIEDDRTGLGDVTLVPWALFWNTGKFHFNFAEYIITPTDPPTPERRAMTLQFRLAFPTGAWRT